MKSVLGYMRLLRRGGRWYVAAKVPKDVIPALGKRLVRYSLNTSDFKTARRQVQGTPQADLSTTETEQMILRCSSQRLARIDAVEFEAPADLTRDEARS